MQNEYKALYGNLSIGLCLYKNNALRILHSFLMLRIIELFTREVSIFLTKQASFYRTLLLLYVYKQNACLVVERAAH